MYFECNCCEARWEYVEEFVNGRNWSSYRATNTDSLDWDEGNAGNDYFIVDEKNDAKEFDEIMSIVEEYRYQVRQRKSSVLLPGFPYIPLTDVPRLIEDEYRSRLVDKDGNELCPNCLLGYVIKQEEVCEKEAT